MSSAATTSAIVSLGGLGGRSICLSATLGRPTMVLWSLVDDRFLNDRLANGGRLLHLTPVDCAAKDLPLLGPVFGGTWR
jgi:hypothetical protein